MVLLPTDKEGGNGVNKLKINPSTCSGSTLNKIEGNKIEGLTSGITLSILGINMNYAIITAKIDPQDKREAQQVAEELGLTLSAVIKAMLKQFIRAKRLEVSMRSEIPNEYLQSVMRQARENRKTGKGSPIFDNIEDNLKWLDEQGI